MGDEDLGVGTMEGAMPDVADVPEDISLAMEKEMLGVYITGHPLRNYADKIKAISTVAPEELNHKDGEADDAMGPVSYTHLPYHTHLLRPPHIG